MKTLYLQRHAKAERDGAIHDFSRNLKPSGIEDAHRMGRYLMKHGFSGDRIVASPAARALQTARLVAEHTGEPMIQEPRLYQQGPGALERVLSELQELESVRIVGHNPDLEQLCELLCGIREGGIHIPTCGVVCLSCDIEAWSDIGPGCARLEWAIRPMHV